MQLNAANFLRIAFMMYFQVSFLHARTMSATVFAWGSFSSWSVYLIVWTVKE
jgi:hypothetical protein